MSSTEELAQKLDELAPSKWPAAKYLHAAAARLRELEAALGESDYHIQGQAGYANRLYAENNKLRERIAELEAERHNLNNDNYMLRKHCDDLQRRLDSAPPIDGTATALEYISWYNTDGPGKDNADT